MKDKKQPILKVENLVVDYGRGKDSFRALDSVSFQIYKGESFGLVGESGSGKTTIGRAIIGLIPVSGGQIIYRGQLISGPRKRRLRKELTSKIQMIFQDPISSLNERAKIDYIVAEGLYGQARKYRSEEIIEKVNKSLRDVGLLAEHGLRFPHEFSGGQRQRIGIARALIMEPEFIIADEPISALDVSVRAQIMNLLMELQRERGLTYLFISHDLSTINYMCQRVGVIYKGRILELGETAQVFSNPIHPYTKSLISAIPVPDPLIEKGKTLIEFSKSTGKESFSKEGRWVEVENGHHVFHNF